MAGFRLRFDGRCAAVTRVNLFALDLQTGHIGGRGCLPRMILLTRRGTSGGAAVAALPLFAGCCHDARRTGQRRRTAVFSFVRAQTVLGVHFLGQNVGRTQIDVQFVDGSFGADLVRHLLVVVTSRTGQR